MRKRVGWIALLLGLTLLGCTNSQKRPAANTASRGRSNTGGTRDSVVDTTPLTTPLEPSTVSPVKGMLAGQVLDKFDHPVAKVSIEVIETSEAGQKSAPVTIWTDTKGYFIIPGLDPSSRYQLTASVKDGDRTMAGTMYVKPPNPHIAFVVSEDYVNESTPKPVLPPAVNETPAIKPKVEDKKPEEKKPEEKKPDASLGGPRVPRPDPPPPPPVKPEPEEGDTPTGRNPRPDLRIVVPSMRAPTVPRSGHATPMSYNSQAAPVPSCVMDTQNKLDNFALQDVDGNNWEFRRDRKGRLVLLDFWFTKCPPCLHAIQELKELNAAYASRGLEVIGVAYEEKGSRREDQKPITFAEAIGQVRGVQGRLNIPYRLLMSGYEGPLKQCPLATQMNVNRFPTLKLVDEQGNIVLQSEGLDARGRQELKSQIERRLPLTPR